MPRKTMQERGPIAAWLIESRKARGWTADVFLAELAKTDGYAPTRPNYARWESGAAHPSDESMARLTRFWGRFQVSPPHEVPAAEPTDPMVAAISALVDELREWRIADRTRIAELEATVDRLVSGDLAGRGSAGEAELDALRATRE